MSNAAILLLTRLTKLAVDCGYDKEPVEDGDWLRFASTWHGATICLREADLAASPPQREPGCNVAVDARFATQDLEHVAGISRNESASLHSPPTLIADATHYLIRGLGAFEELLRRVGKTARTLASPGNDQALDPHGATQTAIRNLPAGTEVTREVVQRIGQQNFRAGLIAYWRGRCAVTGMDCVPLLKASHIKPWAACDSDEERLNVFNGLLLAPHLDATFDGGWISFSADGRLLVSPDLSPTNQQQLGIAGEMHLRTVDAEHRNFLHYHHRCVFRIR